MAETAKRSPETILQNQVDEGEAATKKPAIALSLSAFSAGLELGFSLLLMLAVISILGGHIESLGGRLILSLMYAVGFIFVILGRSELFTEHTTLQVLPYLSGAISLQRLLRSWMLIWVANLIGIFVITIIIVKLAVPLGIIDPTFFPVLAEILVNHPAQSILFSAVLAGWLMGLLSWLVAAGRDTISQIIIVIMITTTIGFLQLHHSILGSGEVLIGVLTSPTLHMTHFLVFLLLSTLGNIIGGAVFVALIKYGHIGKKSLIVDARNN